MYFTYRNFRCAQELQKSLQRTQRGGLDMNACLGQLNVTKGTLQLPSNFISGIKITNNLKHKYRLDQ